MDKHLLNRVDSSGSLEEVGIHLPAAATKTSNKMSTKCKTILLLVAGILAVLIGCAVVLAAVGTSRTIGAKEQPPHHHQRDAVGDPLIEAEEKEELLKKVVDISRARRSGRGGSRDRSQQGSQITSCYSTQNNESYTAAHISGRGSTWNILDASNTNGYWNTSWVCANDSNGDAFVDGGMIFNQTDKKLYVPFCGYYHISSMVYFFVRGINSMPQLTSSYVLLEVYVDRNCNFRDDRVLLRAYASMLVNETTHIGKASAYIGDVVKICRGGSIYVFIPDDRYNPCCPFGKSQTTYLSSFLVSKTNCHEPRSYPKPIIGTA